MKSKFQLLASLAIVGAAFTFTSCEEDEPTPPVTNTVVLEDNEKEITSNITVDTRWYKDTIYILSNRVFVESGAELTIDAGTVIKGGPGAGQNATALIVARGAKINAVGTASEPIIFTSTADPIQPGELTSVMPNNLQGLWGGVIILGNAPISVAGNVEEAAIEGIPATDSKGKYGGTNIDDNSGVIKYISIRHGGSDIGEGNEINGLTLGGVGRLTEIENVEVVANKDDGIEFFGGSVNVTNALVWNNGDDAIDTDQAWSGTLTNVVIINPGDEGFELDGPEGSTVGTGHTITNATLYADGASGLVDLDDNSDVNFTNVLFLDLNEEEVQDVEGYAGYAANTNNFAAANWEVVLPAGGTLTNYFPGGADLITTVVANEASATVGANTSAFTGWTWAEVAADKF